MILVFDTSGKDINIGLVDDSGVIVNDFAYSPSANERGVHDQLLAEQTFQLLSQSGSTMKDITRIGFINGPGSFTGLRIGVAFAKGLAFGSSAKLVPLIAHEVIAQQYIGSMSLGSADGIVTAGYEPSSVYYAPFEHPEAVTLVPISDIELMNVKLLLGSPALQESIESLGIRFVPMALSMEMIAASTMKAVPAEDISDLEPFYGTDFKPHQSALK